MALLLARATTGGPRGAVRLVDDHQLRTAAQEGGRVALCLDVVDADDRERVIVEDAYVAAWEPALEGRHGAGAHDDGVDGELLLQFAPPLVAEMRRADDGKPPDLATVQQL